MSAYDYDPPRGDAHYDDRWDRERERERERYHDPRDVRESTYVKGHPTSSRELVPRHRDEANLVVDYPAGHHHSSSRDVRRTRSAEPGYYDDDYYYYPDERDGRRHRSRGGSSKKGYADTYYEAEEKRRRRVLGRQEKIIAAVAGAALALGGKEIYDRRAAATAEEEEEIHRNYLHSAALGAAGAVVGYQGAEFYNKKTSKSDRKSSHAVYRGRDGKMYEDYHSDSDEDPSAKKGAKKFLESALGVTSLGAAMKALAGGSDKDRDDKSRSGRSPSRDSTRSTRSRANSMSKIQKAAMASLLAGATEAFRIAKEPGGWKGEKAKRVVTAAIGAGAIGGAHDDKHGKRDIAESVIGGLLGNRLVHGSKKNIEEDETTGRSRSRSRLRSRSESQGGGGSGAHGGLAALASAGLAAFGAKKALGGRDDSRGRSESPDRRHRSRSRSVVDSARKSLAKLGIGSDPTDDRRDDASDYGGSRSSRRRRHYSDDDDDSYDGGHHRSSRRGRDDRHTQDDHDDYDDDRSYRPRRSRGGGDGKPSDAGSDLGDSSDDERRARKMRDRRH